MRPRRHKPPARGANFNVNTAALSTHGLSKRFGSRPAVRDLDLEVRHGEVFGFLGPNGAGKTTTIRMMLGLIRPSAGTVEILGRDVQADGGRVLPRVGALVEAPALYLYLTSMGVCLLIGTAAATLGRSLAFGIGAALAFFPIDNFGTALLRILNLLTGWHVWLDVSAYLLGPNLNALPVLMEKDHTAHAAFATPLVTVDATHAWLVIAAWSLGMVALTVVLTWRRDVLQ